MNRDRPLLTTVFLACMGLLAYELTLTRLFSVTMWYHMAFMAISLAMFGLALAGCWVFVAGHRFPVERHREQIARFAALQGGAMAVAVPILLAVPYRGQVNLQGAISLAVIYVTAASPFLFAGLVITLALTHRSDMVGRIYFADLTGAALGCLLVVPGLSLLGGPTMLVVLGALPALAAVVLARADGYRRPLRIAGGVLVGISLLAGLGSFTPLLQVQHTKGGVQGRLLFDRWNSFSRVTVRELEQDRLPPSQSPQQVFTCGLGSRFQGPIPAQRFIAIDGVAGTPLTAFDGNLQPLSYLDYEVTSLAYHLRPEGRVLIIGPGGGEDVLAAQRIARPSSITAVEINPLMETITRQAFPKFAGPVYDLPGVRLVIGEGRVFVARSRDSYDVIQASMVDTWAATAAGAYTLTENNLYTVEAFQEYYQRLSEGGLFTMSRFLFEPPRQSLRLVGLCRTVMDQLGVAEPSRQVIMVREPLQQVSTLLWKKGPFSEQEIDRVVTEIRRCGFEPIFLPGRGGHPAFRQILETEDLDGFIKEYPFDIRPSTDDRPFFFNAVRLRHLLQVFRIPAAERFNYTAVFVLVVLLGVVLLLTLGAIILPLMLIRRRMDTSTGTMLRTAAYFGLIGLAFMVVEIVLIQRFILLLGHPIYALTVLVFSLLLGGGIGSWLSRRVPDEGLARGLRVALIALALALLLIRWLLPGLCHLALPWPIAARIALTVGVIFPLGILMGFPFPLGLRIAAERHPRLVPWAYGVNGAASVLSSVLAVTLAMNGGYGAALAVGQGLYLLALLGP